ncbi:hypothetical protein [Mycoplasma phocimorsus]|uniref:hypothetical protein n=1 Tax=Mycoplasma phocimorsus TaxID=3045839 RepID=UPI0024C0D685|nr:hypothetical protein [Mycoplasma phocimorsus]MDJ1648205.1 hypothetical protein [Mycoplasma phocimorsus]MDJ1648652.1 hypothetical protein [Mycoplasma phocimorsus]
MKNNNEIEILINPIRTYKDVKNREDLFILVKNKFNKSKFIIKIIILGYLLAALFWSIPLMFIHFFAIIPEYKINIAQEGNSKLIVLIITTIINLIAVLCWFLVLCNFLKLIFHKIFYEKNNEKALKHFLVLSGKTKLLKYLDIYNIHPDWNLDLLIANLLTIGTNQVLWGSLARKIYIKSLNKFTKLNDIDIINGDEIYITNNNVKTLNVINKSPYYSLLNYNDRKIEYISVKYLPNNLIITKNINNYNIKLISEEGVIASSINQLCFLILKYPESQKLASILNDINILIKDTLCKMINIIDAYNILLVNNAFLYLFVEDISRRIFIDDFKNLGIIIQYIEKQELLKESKEKILLIIKNLFNNQVSTKLAKNIKKLFENKNLIVDLYYELEEEKLINFDKLILEFSNIENKNKMLQTIGETDWLFEEIAKKFKFLNKENSCSIMLQYIIMLIITSKKLLT